MTGKDLLKTIITDSQQRVIPEIWERMLKIPEPPAVAVNHRATLTFSAVFFLFFVRFMVLCLVVS